MIFTPRELAQLRQLELLARKVTRGQLQGEREMRRRGPGSGFREHRSYHPGDALRRVDWNVYARMETLVIKEFDAEEALDLVLVQDCSASMDGAASRSAAKICGALGAIALSRVDGVLWVPVGGARPAESFTGRGRIQELLETVDAKSSGGTDLLGAVRAALPRHTRGGVAFVVGDFFDARSASAALSHLLAHRYRLRVVLLEDPVALAPPPPGRTRIVDRETGEALRLEIDAASVERFQRALQARARGLAAFCRRTGAGFLQLRADQPFFGVVRAALARGWLSR